MYAIWERLSYTALTSMIDKLSDFFSNNLLNTPQTPPQTWILFSTRFKLGLLVYHAISGQSPPYISELVSHVTPHCTRPADKNWMFREQDLCPWKEHSLWLQWRPGTSTTSQSKVLCLLGSLSISIIDHHFFIPCTSLDCFTISFSKQSLHLLISAHGLELPQ